MDYSSQYLVKYSRSYPPINGPINPRIQAEWTHWDEKVQLQLNVTSSAVESQAQSQLRYSLRVITIGDGAKGHVLEDLDLSALSSLSNPTSISNSSHPPFHSTFNPVKAPGTSLKAVHRESLVAFRYLHIRVSETQSVPCYRRFQLNFNSTTDATAFVQSVSPICPFAASPSSSRLPPSSNNNLSRMVTNNPTIISNTKPSFAPSRTQTKSSRLVLPTLPRNSQNSVPSSSPSDLYVPNTLSARTRTSFVPSRTPVAFTPSHGTLDEVSSFTPSSSFIAPSSVSRNHNNPFNTSPLGDHSHLDHFPSSSQSSQLASNSDLVPKTFHSSGFASKLPVVSALSDEVSPSEMPQIRAAVPPYNNLQTPLRSTEHSNFTHSSTLKPSSPRPPSESTPSSPTPSPQASHPIADLSPASQLLSSLSSLPEFYNLPTPELEKIISEVVREDGFLELMKKIEGMWAVRQFVNM